MLQPILVARDVHRWAKPVRFFETVDAFLDMRSPLNGISAIKHHGALLDFMFVERESDTLIVSFHAALDTRLGKKIPIFSGQNVTGNKHSVLFVSDPSLSLHHDLKLGWFHGTSRCDFIHIFPDILNYYITSTNKKKVVFFGISGGGYAAALFSAKFPGSIAVAINPQTLIWRFNEISVKTYIDSCFNKTENYPTLEASVRKNIGGDLREYYKNDIENRLVYVQNATDHHVDLHARPFFESLTDGALGHVTYLSSNEWGNGHIAPPASYIFDLLALATDRPEEIPHGRFPSS